MTELLEELQKEVQKIEDHTIQVNPLRYVTYISNSIHSTMPYWVTCILSISVINIKIQGLPKDW